MRIKVAANVPMLMNENNNPTFEKWMERIDGLIMRYAGLSVYDLPDCPFHDWYDKRLRPIWAANKALARASEDI